MQRGLFFTTMANHRPVYTATTSQPQPQPQQEPPSHRGFQGTAARDSSDERINPNNPPPLNLRNILARSTQPTFSVSEMFRVRSGGGCGGCGH
jgi:hypothetical protein